MNTATRLSKLERDATEAARARWRAATDRWLDWITRHPQLGARWVEFITASSRAGAKTFEDAKRLAPAEADVFEQACDAELIPADLAQELEASYLALAGLDPHYFKTDASLR